jgi:hypothetical protein
MVERDELRTLSVLLVHLGRMPIYPYLGSPRRIARGWGDIASLLGGDDRSRKPRWRVRTGEGVLLPHRFRFGRMPFVFQDRLEVLTRVEYAARGGALRFVLKRMGVRVANVRSWRFVRFILLPNL